MRTPMIVYGLTIAAVLLAGLLRWLIDPILGDHIPYPTFFVAVAAAAWLGGLRPALLATGLGLMMVLAFFMPSGTLSQTSGGPHLVGLAMYLVVCLFFAFFGESVRKSHARLAEHAERLRTTLASIGDAVIITDVSGRVTKLNAVAEALTGWKNSEATGEPLEAVFHIVNETTRKPVANPAVRVLRENVTVGLANHTVLIAKDGTEHAIDDSAAPIRTREGEVIGCILIFRDIGDQRKLQRQAGMLASIVHSSDDAIISKSLQGVIQSWNASAERLFGYTAEEAIGRSILMVIPKDRVHEEDHILGQLKAGKRIEHFDTVRVRKDGQSIHVSLSISPVLDDSGEIIGAAKIVRDITQRKREEQIQAERTELTALRADISITLSLAQSAAKTLRDCCETIVQRRQNWSAWVWTLEQETSELELQAAQGNGTEDDDGTAFAPVRDSRLQKIAQTGKPYLTTDLSQPEDFDQAWVEKEGIKFFAGYPLIVENRVRGVMAVFARTPMTEMELAELSGLIDSIAQFVDRRYAEEAFRRQAELHRVTLISIGDAVITTDVEGRVTQLNTVAEVLTGWSHQEARGAPLESVFKIINESTRAPVQNPAAKALREGVIVGLANHTLLIARDGTERPIDDSAAPIHNSTGEIVGCVLVFRDITERKQAEEKIQEARSRLESTLVAGEIGTWDFDVVRNAVRADQNLARMFGVTPEEANGGAIEVFQRAIHPSDRDRVLCAIERALEHDNQLESEYRVIGADGQIRWVVARGRVERDSSGNAIRLPGVVVDITRQRLVEAELRASEERRRIALDSAELGAWNIDPATNSMISDARFQTIIAGAPRPLSFEEVFEFIHPEDRPRIREAVDAATRPGNPVPYSQEYRVVHPDGSVHWVFAKGRTNFEGDRPTSFDGTVADITERKRSEDLIRESEHRLRFILDSMPQKVLTATPEGVVDYFNPVWMQYTGLSYEEIKERGWDAVIHPDDLAESLEAWNSAIATGEPFQVEHRFRRTDGEDRWHVSRATALKDEHQQVVMWVGASTDIHEQRQTADELRDLAARLSEVDHRKDEFLATLAHELRNPLAPLRNGLEVMKLAEGDLEMINECRGMMERQLEQMVRLVDDLMDVSRISRGKLELKLQQVELATVIQSAIETSRPIIEQMGHELTVTLPDHPVFIDADLTRLAQVFLNLLNNAAKYSNPRGHIHLTAVQEDREVVVSVKDTGIGIAPDQLHRIFEMFSQIDHSLEKAQGGLGIGLTLVRRLVELHHGSVVARSEGIGRGSEFIVRLPLMQESSGTSSSAHGVSQENASRSLRVLVVDDNRDSAKTLSIMFNIMGHETRSAHDGEEAIRTAQSFRPQVILLDIGLPKLNGHEVCRRIRQYPWGKEIIIIAQTGWGQEEDRERTRQAGFDHHMVKPVDVKELQAILARLQADRLREST
ncbi:PAS domain S-box protein [Planctomicrobium sp. SH661]|uniref:PAS domain S-box protein n=1 Tax=Planctomicrobium sp. SH661 TaxID=3448124 RepID=UPI003F5C7EE2